jgi:hemerythrin-like domain-containing protein
MVNVAEFSKENQEIVDLSAILNILVNSGDLRDNPVFCDLLSRFRDRIWAHLVHEDKAVYAELLNHPDRSVNEVADQFINNTHSLKKILSTYLKRWCHVPGSIAGDREFNDTFLEETREIFRLVDERISLENSKLFPIILNKR